jgi:hypothetical protein
MLTETILVPNTSSPLQMTTAAEENLPDGQFVPKEQELNTDMCLIHRKGTRIPSVLKQDRIYNNKNNNSIQFKFIYVQN